LRKGRELASAAGRHADQDADAERHRDRQQRTLLGFIGNTGERRVAVSRCIFAERGSLIAE
jgi:hypothetical protein